MVITPGKNFIGQEGFPTPSDIPSDTACRSFVLPDNDEWFGLLMGAVELLLNPHNYFNYGALSIDDTVDAWQLIIQDAYDRSLTAQCAPEIPAPYWETAANVLDEAPSLVQSWYGQLFGGLTFIEALGNIFVGAFVLAGAGLGATIQFLVLARRFRLAFRAHDLGSIVRIFINADEYGTVDTYSASPNIIFYDVYAEQFTGGDGPYTLWVEQHSSSSMEAIRKELREDEVYPVNVKYDSGTDEVQEDYGSGFVDNPNRDPRHATSLLYPPVTGADPRCLAAGNMTDFFDNLLTAVEDALAGASSATALWAVILPFLIELGPFAVLIELVAALATVLFTAGDTALHAAFTTTTFDTLLCIFYCNIRSDGQVSAAQLDAIKSDITDQFGAGVVNDVMLAALFLMGEVGLSNKGTLGASSRTCDSCECCPDPVDWCETILDISVDNDGGFAPDNSDPIWGGFTHPVAIFANNTGSPPPDNYAWVTTEVTRSSGEEIARIMIASRVFPSGTYTDVRFHWQVQFGTFTTDIRECTVKIDGETMLDEIVDGEGDAHWTGSITGTPTIAIRYVCSYRVDSGSGGGGGEFTNLIVEGSGTKPIF